MTVFAISVANSAMSTTPETQSLRRAVSVPLQRYTEADVRVRDAVMKQLDCTATSDNRLLLSWVSMDAIAWKRVTFLEANDRRSMGYCACSVSSNVRT